jgi:hypothetical protein
MSASFAAALESGVDKGVAERPPVEGYHYAPFAVHPPNPSDVMLGFAIAHREGEQFVLDLVRENLRISECAGYEALRHYRSDRWRR